MKCIFIFIILGITCFKSNANHWIGAEASYECLGNNKYRVSIKVYRDTVGLAGFNTPLPLGIYWGKDSLYAMKYLNIDHRRIVPYSVDINCIEVPNEVVVEEAIYITEVTLPPSDSPYTLVYQTYSRGSHITNLLDPWSQGMTVWTVIRNDSISGCNSSPVFDKFPPVPICVNEPFVFDYSAIDPDGDSLVYEFCAPYVYNWPPGGIPADPPNPPGTNGYDTVTYVGPYTSKRPLGGNPAIKIDSASGVITGTPTVQGFYVVGVCVKEYRNGTLLGVHLRDFQFSVLACPKLASIVNIPDTMVLCKPYVIDFRADQNYAKRFFWDFGDHTTRADTSRMVDPTWEYSSPGNYTVTLVAWDDHNCADTAKVKITVFKAPTPEVIGLDRVCSGDSVTLTIRGGLNDYSWEPKSSAIQVSDSSFVVFPDKNTNYIFSASYDNCKWIDSHRVLVDTIVPFVSLPNDTTLCEGESIRVSNIVPLDNVLWNTGSEEDTIHINIGGVYWLVSNNSCGEARDSLRVQSTPIPQADAGLDETIQLGQSVTLNGSGGLLYTWLPPSGLSDTTIRNPEANPDTTTTYTVFVTDSNGCVAKDAMTVFVEKRCGEFVLPNAFTPNNDGLNDKLEALQVEGLSEFIRLEIYNRWGELVYATQDLSQGWDGTYRDEPQQPGSFMYVLRYSCEGVEEVKTGSVTLLR